MKEISINNYDNGINEIISLMKEMNSGLTNHISNLNLEISNLHHQINLLREDNLRLIARNIELEAKQNKNSNNSSKPPSTNNNKKPSNSRKKTERSTGGQVGHEGKTQAAKSSGAISKKTGKPIKSNALRLLQKLEKFDIETLAFMYDFSIPFDNNLAERDIRMVKLRQKISGCFRGDNGGNWFCRIRSYVSTCNKNGQDIMEAMKNAIKGVPFIPENA